MSSIIGNAVYKLKGLERSMRSTDRTFTDDDIDNIDKIADYLQQLESEVKKIHEQFEAETIIASVLRHKYTFYPDEIKNEIQNAVKAARDSNMSVINSLQEQLNSILKSIDEGNKKDEELTKKISQLKPEKENTLLRHEDVISLLNSRLTEKAQCQIKLNEIRDSLEETKQSTVDLEEDILILRENLVVERKNAREEKIDLEENKVETIGAALLQEAKNEDKSKELNRVLEALKISDEKLKVLFRENERLEVAIEELKINVAESEAALVDEKNILDALRLENSSLSAADNEARKNYMTTKHQLTEETRQIVENRAPLELLKQLKTDEDFLRDQLKQVYDMFKTTKHEVDQLSKIVDHLKAQIGAQLTDMTFVDTKNKKAYDGLSSLEESHNQIMEALQRELDEYRAQLTDEREYKLRKQQERNAKIAEIQTFQSESQNEQQSGQRYLSYGKSRFGELSRRMDEIERNKVQNEQLAIDLAVQEETLKDKYNKMKSKLETEAKQLEGELNVVQTELNSVTVLIDEKKPDYEELIKTHNQKNIDAEKAKKLVYSKKKEKINLIDHIKETKEKIVEHDESRKFTDIQIHSKREESIQKMKRQHEEIKILENQILDTGMRLDSVAAENEKFELAIKSYEDELNNLKQKTLQNGDNTEDLITEYSLLQEDLEYGFKSDAIVEAFFEEKDSDLISKLSSLLETTKTREAKVSGISDKFHRGINELSKYLESVLGTKENLIFGPFNPLTTKTQSETTINTNNRLQSPSSFDGLSTESQCGTVANMQK